MNIDSLTYKQRFIKNLSLLYLATIITKIFALCVNIILVRKLGASIYGAFGFTLTFVTFFTLIADSGLSSYGETAISKNKEDVKKIAGDIFSFNLILACLASALILFLTIAVFRFDEVQTEMLMLISFLPLIDIFGFNYVIRALEKNHIIALSTFFGRLVYFIGILIFVIHKSDYLYAILFFIIGALITAFIQFGFIMKIIGRIHLNYNFGSLKFLAVNGMPYGFVSALLVFYGSLPVLFLKILSNNQNIGYYYMAGRLIFFISSFTGLIIGAFIPIISESIKNEDYGKQSSILNELLRFNYTLLIPICLGGVALSRLIVSVLFGPEYIITANVIDIMIGSIFFMGTSSILGGYLTAVHDRKGLIAATIIVSLIALFVVPVLIVFFGLYGGAASSLFSEFLMTVFLIIFTLKRGKGKAANKKISIKIDGSNFIKVLLISAIMACIVLFMDIFWHSNLPLCIMAGFFIYFILSLLLGTISKKDLAEVKGMVRK